LDFKPRLCGFANFGQHDYHDERAGKRDC
jgi:hypothetical protein